MLKRDHLRQAIDAISHRDPEAGYTLEEMFAAGAIDTLSGREAQKGDPAFHFEREKIFINKTTFFIDSISPLEQALLIKYGELKERQQALAEIEGSDYPSIAGRVQRAGLEFMVAHEIDYALERLKQSKTGSGPSPDPALVSRIGSIKSGKGTGLNHGPGPSPVLFEAVLGDQAAFFSPFPYTWNSLIQVAALDLDYFHVRFLLDCLVRRVDHNIFTCSIGHEIKGLVYIVLLQELFHTGIEIKYLATRRGKTRPFSGQQAVTRGLGTFLVAGVWMLWKTFFEDVKEISLDSEVAAETFYVSIGFKRRGRSRYVLKKPEGRLLRLALSMANRCPCLPAQTQHELGRLAADQVRPLLKKRKAPLRPGGRKVLSESVKECLHRDARPVFARYVAEELGRHESNDAEFQELVRFIREYGSDEAKRLINYETPSGY